MRPDVLERKIAHVIVELAKELHISEERALDLFYASQTYRHLVNPQTDLHLRSNGYIIEEFMREPTQ